MKNSIKRILSFLLTLCVISSLSAVIALAAVQSSDYLDSYRATVIAQSGGRIVVLVDVSGCGIMDEIGANAIYLYESQDNVNFYRVGTYNHNDYPAMMTSDSTDYYDTPITYNGTPGYYYKASVYVYAGKNGGGDQRNYLTASKRAIN
ncbi:MAG: hypothetical protein Q4A15_02300 [Prevotellaceae bacterium]|nr:hypothetical protein [Prevotellaceae bacterium]